MARIQIVRIAFVACFFSACSTGSLDESSTAQAPATSESSTKPTMPTTSTTPTTPTTAPQQGLPKVQGIHSQQVTVGASIATAVTLSGDTSELQVRINRVGANGVAQDCAKAIQLTADQGSTKFTLTASGVGAGGQVFKVESKTILAKGIAQIFIKTDYLPSTVAAPTCKLEVSVPLAQNGTKSADGAKEKVEQIDQEQPKAIGEGAGDSFDPTQEKKVDLGAVHGGAEADLVVEGDEKKPIIE